MSLANLKSKHLENAIALEKSGQLQKAALEYESALRESPLSIRILLAFSKFSIRLKDYTRAVQLLQELVKHNPSDEHFYLLGECLFHLQDFRESIRFLKKSIELNHHYLNSHLLLAFVYEKLGNLYKKEHYLKNALEVDNKNVRVLGELVSLYYHTFRYKEALSFLDKMELAEPNQFKKIATLRVEILVKMGKFATAREIVKELMDSDEKVRRKINLVLSNPQMRRDIEEKLTEVKKKFKENEKSTHRNPALAMEISILYLSVGNFEAASKFLVYSRKTLEENRGFTEMKKESLGKTDTLPLL